MNIDITSIPCAAFAALTSCIIASSAQATMLATNDFEASTKVKVMPTATGLKIAPKRGPIIRIF